MCIKVNVYTHERSAESGDRELVLTLHINCGMVGRPGPPKHVVDQFNVTTAHPAIKISLHELLMTDDSSSATDGPAGQKKKTLKMQWASSAPTELSSDGGGSVCKGTGPFCVPEDHGAQYVDLAGMLQAFWRYHGYAYYDLCMERDKLDRRLDGCGFMSALLRTDVREMRTRRMAVAEELEPFEDALRELGDGRVLERVAMAGE